MVHFNQPRVLICDGNPTIRRLLRLYLQGDEFKVVADASEGQRALDLVAEQRPDIVLMEYQLPGIPGCEATQQITTRFPETLVIMISGREDLDAAREAMSSGARDFLAKPLSRAEVLRTLRRLYETPRAVLIHGSGGASKAKGVWSFVGTNTGDGRSAIMLGLAYELLTSGKRVVLVDTAPLHGDLSFLLGMNDSPPFLSDLLEHPSFLLEKVIRGHLREHDSGLSLLAGASSLASAYAMDMARMVRLCEPLQEIYEYVLMDFSAGVPEELLPVLDLSRFVFPTAPAHPHGVRDLCTLVEVLSGLGYQEPKLRPLLLDVDDRGPDYWLEDAGFQVDFTFPPESTAISRSLRAGQPIPRVSPRSKLARLIRNFSGHLMKGERSKPSPRDPEASVPEDGGKVRSFPGV